MDSRVFGGAQVHATGLFGPSGRPSLEAASSIQKVSHAPQPSPSQSPFRGGPVGSRTNATFSRAESRMLLLENQGAPPTGVNVQWLHALSDIQ